MAYRAQRAALLTVLLLACGSAVQAARSLHQFPQQQPGFPPFQQFPSMMNAAGFNNAMASMAANMNSMSSTLNSNTQAVTSQQRPLGVERISVPPNRIPNDGTLLLEFYNGTQLLLAPDGSLQASDGSSDVTSSYDAAGFAQLRKAIDAMVGGAMPAGFQSSVSRDGSSVAVSTAGGGGGGQQASSVSTTSAPAGAFASGTSTSDAAAPAGSSQQQQQQQQLQQQQPVAGTVSTQAAARAPASSGAAAAAAAPLVSAVVAAAVLLLL